MNCQSMMKWHGRLAGLLVFVVWTFTDYGLHIGMLEPLQHANPALWRPLKELSIALVS